LRTILETLLTNKYQDNLEAMADDFLYENKSDLVASGKSAVIDMIVREFAIQDQIFNLYEEEYIAAKHLKLVKPELWEYWNFYIRSNFSNKRVSNHWQLRRELYNVFPKFTEFVEQEYHPSKNTDDKGKIPS
jgi:hypothetical protein